MYRLDRIQSLASLVAVLVSITALLVCLVVYLLFPALRCATSGRCLICLVVCLFMGLCSATLLTVSVAAAQQGALRCGREGVEQNIHAGPSFFFFILHSNSV